VSDRTDAIPVSILLVEDDAGDALLIRKALKDGKINNSVDTVTDGAAALAYLRGQPPHTGAARPDLILLDLNLPKIDGRQVLAEAKNDPDLRQIPVIILTTSRAEEDVIRSYDLHANAYVEKPFDINQFIRAVQKIDEFFLTVARLSPR